MLSKVSRNIRCVAVPEISPDHHIRLSGQYLIIYHLDTLREVVTLVRVVHGARDWLALFGDDEL